MPSLVDTDPIEGHTARAFDTALSELRLHLVSMGGLAIDQVATAMRALLDGDESLARLVLSRESLINDFERTIDREAFRLIALHQPVASDLRMAKAASRIVVELERVGDEAKKIARFAIASGGRRAAGAGERGRTIPAQHGRSHGRHAARSGACAR